MANTTAMFHLGQALIKEQEISEEKVILTTDMFISYLVAKQLKDNYKNVCHVSDNEMW